MSVRLEWTEAQYAGPSVHKQGDELADGNTVTMRAALGIGATVVEGFTTDLLDMLEKGRKLLDPNAMARVRAVAQWELGDPSWANRLIEAWLNPDSAGAAEALAGIEGP